MSAEPTPIRMEKAQIKVEEQRTAMGSTQRMSAGDASSRAQSTKARNARREQTGRADLLEPIAPVPRQVLVSVMPARADDPTILATASRWRGLDWDACKR